MPEVGKETDAHTTVQPEKTKSSSSGEKDQAKKSRKSRADTRKLQIFPTISGIEFCQASIKISKISMAISLARRRDAVKKLPQSTLQNNTCLTKCDAKYEIFPRQ